MFKVLLPSALIYAANSVRTVVTKTLATKFPSIDDAEEAYGLGLDKYILSSTTADADDSASNLSAASLLPHCITDSQCAEILTHIISKLSHEKLTDLCLEIFEKLNASGDIIPLIGKIFSLLVPEAMVCVLDNLFSKVLSTMKFEPVSDFISHSIEAMGTLHNKQKPNVLYKLARGLSVKRSNGQPLLPTDRMPWGLLQYQIEFFNCSHINEVSTSTFVTYKGCSKSN